MCFTQSSSYDLDSWRSETSITNCPAVECGTVFGGGMYLFITVMIFFNRLCIHLFGLQLIFLCKLSLRLPQHAIVIPLEADP